MEKEFDGEEFVEAVMQAAREYLNHTTTIEDAIAGQKAQIESTRKNFKCLWEAYETVSKNRNKKQDEMTKIKIKMFITAIIVSLLDAFVKEDMYVQVMEVHNGVSKSIDDIKREKELLRVIKEAIQELEKYQAIDCNYDLSLLLSLIYDKNNLIYGIIKEDIESLSVRIKGINFSSNTNKREELKSINEEIDEKVKLLGLKPKY